MLKTEKKGTADKLSKRKQRELENEKLIIDTWQHNSDIGKFKYAMRFGAFTWGFPTFVIYSIIMVILNFFVKESIKYNGYQAIFSLFFFIVFGTIYGFVLWNKNEKIYRKKFPYGKK